MKNSPIICNVCETTLQQRGWTHKASPDGSDWRCPECSEKGREDSRNMIRESIATSATMDKKHCAGCHDNFYNGNNPYGVQKCWSLKTATLVQRVAVPTTQRPPWTQPPQLVPDCYRKPGYVYVKPDNPSCRKPATVA